MAFSLAAAWQKWQNNELELHNWIFALDEGGRYVVGAVTVIHDNGACENQSDVAKNRRHSHSGADTRRVKSRIGMKTMHEPAECDG